jgi:hypothetical protein
MAALLGRRVAGGPLEHILNVLSAHLQEGRYRWRRLRPADDRAASLGPR